MANNLTRHMNLRPSNSGSAGGGLSPGLHVPVGLSEGTGTGEGAQAPPQAQPYPLHQAPHTPPGACSPQLTGLSEMSECQDPEGAHAMLTSDVSLSGKASALTAESTSESADSGLLLDERADGLAALRWGPNSLHQQLMQQQAAAAAAGGNGDPGALSIGSPGPGDISSAPGVPGAAPQGPGAGLTPPLPRRLSEAGQRGSAYLPRGLSTSRGPFTELPSSPSDTRFGGLDLRKTALLRSLSRRTEDPLFNEVANAAGVGTASGAGCCPSPGGEHPHVNATANANAVPATPATAVAGTGGLGVTGGGADASALRHADAATAGAVAGSSMGTAAHRAAYSTPGLGGLRGAFAGTMVPGATPGMGAFGQGGSVGMGAGVGAGAGLGALPYGASPMRPVSRSDSVVSDFMDTSSNSGLDGGSGGVDVEQVAAALRLNPQDQDGGLGAGLGLAAGRVERSGLSVSSGVRDGLGRGGGLAGAAADMGEPLGGSSIGGMGTAVGGRCTGGGAGTGGAFGTGPWGGISPRCEGAGQLGVASPGPSPGHGLGASARAPGGQQAVGISPWVTPPQEAWGGAAPGAGTGAAAEERGAAGNADGS